MKRVVIEAGRHARAACPVVAPWDGPAPEGLAAEGVLTAAQAHDQGLAFVLPTLAAESRAALDAAPAAPPGAGVSLRDNGKQVDVEIGGRLFTSYHYADVPARPYLWPVMAPGEVQATRAYPMIPDVAGETHDHKHHRSMYFAYGDVNGVDNWSEEPGHGRTEHRTIDRIVSGSVYGLLETTSDWLGAAGEHVLQQKLALTFWNTGADLRMVDVDLRLTADTCDVRFGDTKEGGLISFRVASSMDVPRGGKIENSWGGINEPENWGLAAHWCDYSGTAEGKAVGICVMDHPDSFRYPTYWHVRDYGLFTANPFALHDYTQGRKEGSHLLKQGETLRFRYRALIHAGDAGAVDARARYLDFVAPPRAAGE